MQKLLVLYQNYISMKLYKVAKWVYANSLVEAITKEKDSPIVDAFMVDEFTEEDWNADKEKRRKARLVANKTKNGGE